MLRAVLTPMALSLNRLMIAAAQRFPELAAFVARAGSLAIDRPTFAAERFLQLAVTLPQRRAPGLGPPMTEANLDAWADDCVNLFLNGCRFWQPRAPGSEAG